MMMWNFITSAWEWEPSIVIGCAALIIGYLALVRSRITWRSLYYFAGVLILIFGLISPLDELADTYLFSAHMVQHLLFILVVPPLMLLGIPEWLAQRGMKISFIRKTERILGKPLVAWSAAAGAMWFWHIPPAFNTALANETLHLIEHLSILLLGTIFWWTVIDPLHRKRLSPLSMVFFLFSACVACTILGIVITFSAPGLYPAYLHPLDDAGILPVIRNDWGFSPGIDQQVGGLLMWVPACLIYLSAIIGMLARWYNEPDEGLTPGREKNTLPVAQKIPVTPERKIEEIEHDRL